MPDPPGHGGLGEVHEGIADTGGDLLLGLSEGVRADLGGHRAGHSHHHGQHGRREDGDSLRAGGGRVLGGGGHGGVSSRVGRGLDSRM
ncbi:MAG: hypothetical protein ACRDSH_21365 [Pseudonocardiaceae bacterium]